MSTEVHALQARLQAYEHREAQWKQQLEKAQLEHTQLLSLQQKLTQAGTHLKTLAADNSRLQKQLKEHQLSSLSEHSKVGQLQTERDELAAQLQQQKKDQHSAIEVLLKRITLREDSDEPITALPDIDNLEQVKQYIDVVATDFRKKLKEKDTVIVRMKSDLDSINARLEEQQTVGQSPPPASPPLVQPGSFVTDQVLISLLVTDIRGLINDTENYAVSSRSLPPQLIAALEELRLHLQSLSDTQQANRLQSVDETKDFKRHITQLEMTVNELSEEKEQWLIEKEDLETQINNDDKSKDDISKTLNELENECQGYKHELHQLQTNHQSVIDKNKSLEETLHSITTNHKDHIDRLSQLHEERQTLLDEVKRLEEALAASKMQQQKAEDQVDRLQREHQALLDKIANIKETLAPRLEADKQLRVKVAELTVELEQAKHSMDEMRSTMVARDEESSQELEKKERHLHQLQMRFENLQREKEESQVATMQLDARCHHLEEENSRLTDELERFKKQMVDELQSSASERASLENLQCVLEEFQTIKDAEVRAAVEHIERQLEIAKKSWTEYEERARSAESTLEQYQHDLAKTPEYEREIKEKNLLIGKLRHEAIILNEHLVEAMRRLKEESNENNVDRQLITNLIVGFFMAPRGDRKRFDILSIIANVLQMTDEQKEQVGLIRMKNNGNGQRATSTVTSAGWQSPRLQEETEPKESFTDAWISFLLKESSKRKPSISSPVSSPSYSERHDV